VLIGTTHGSQGPQTIAAWSNNIANSYTSIINALSDASHSLPSTLKLTIIDPANLSFNPNNNSPNYLHPSWTTLTSADGIILPNDSHLHATTSSTEQTAKVAIAAYARLHKIPFLSIGSGMHTAVQKFAQNVSSIPHPVPTKEGFLPPLLIQQQRMQAGGAQDIYIPPPSGPSGGKEAQGAFRQIYGEQAIVARERFDGSENNGKRIHPVYVEHMRGCGFEFFCQNEDGEVVDAWKYSGNKHPFYVGVSFHPEFSTRVSRASDVIFEFVQAVYDRGQGEREGEEEEGEGRGFAL
jgi:CTP synthase